MKAIRSKKGNGKSKAMSHTYRTKTKDRVSCNSNYELVVAQQPIRARMCGFGDKDRRPVSPPPIVELMITTKDGKNIDPA